jgi:hypothetical protein
VITVGAPYAPTSIAHLYNSQGQLITQTSSVTAGDQLYVQYDIRDRLGESILAHAVSSETLSKMGMRYVLTAPFNWWGGTEVFSSDQVYRDGETYKINF